VLLSGYRERKHQISEGKAMIEVRISSLENGQHSMHHVMRHMRKYREAADNIAGQLKAYGEAEKKSNESMEIVCRKMALYTQQLEDEIRKLREMSDVLEEVSHCYMNCEKRVYALAEQEIKRIYGRKPGLISMKPIVEIIKKWDLKI
jgi:hypothetical protein